MNRTKIPIQFRQPGLSPSHWDESKILRFSPMAWLKLRLLLRLLFRAIGQSFAIRHHLLTLINFVETNLWAIITITDTDIILMGTTQNMGMLHLIKHLQLR